MKVLRCPSGYLELFWIVDLSPLCLDRMAANSEPTELDVEVYDSRGPNGHLWTVVTVTVNSASITFSTTTDSEWAGVSYILWHTPQLGEWTLVPHNFGLLQIDIVSAFQHTAAAWWPFPSPQFPAFPWSFHHSTIAGFRWQDTLALQLAFEEAFHNETERLAPTSSSESEEKTSQ